MKTELRKIPGVGKAIEQDLINMVYTTIESLKGQNREAMYDQFCDMVGYQEDRCQLYVFRQPETEPAAFGGVGQPVKAHYVTLHFRKPDRSRYAAARRIVCFGVSPNTRL